MWGGLGGTLGHAAKHTYWRNSEKQGKIEINITVIILPRPNLFIIMVLMCRILLYIYKDSNVIFVDDKYI